MPEITEDNSKVLQQIAQNTKRPVLDRINDELVEIRKIQEKVYRAESRDRKDQARKDLKKETAPPEPKVPTNASPVNPSEDEKRQMSYLRKQFTESFGSLKEFFNPGSLLKTFGLFTGSPAFVLIGDKLTSLLDNYKSYSEEQKKGQDEIIMAQKESTQNDFLKEALRDKEMAQRDETNNLLNEIVDNTDRIGEPVKEKKSLKDLLKGPLSLLSRFLPKSLTNILTKVFGSGSVVSGLTGLFTKTLGGSGFLGGIGKLAKSAGKFAAVAALFSTIPDFFKGSKNASKILGRKAESDNAAIEFGNRTQAGLSQAVSGLTLGLLDPKDVSKMIDKVYDKVIGFLVSPFEFIEDITRNKKSLSTTAYEALSKLTFRLFTPDDIRGAVGGIVQNLKDILAEPLKILKDLWNAGKERVLGAINEKITAGKELIDDIKSVVQNITDSILNTINDIKAAFADKIDFLKQKINETKDVLKNPFESIKNLLFSDDETPDATKERAVVVDEGKKKFYPIYIDRTGTLNNEKVAAVKRQSQALAKIGVEQDTRRRKEIERESRANQAAAEGTTNNVVQSNVNNNIYPQEDLRTTTDDDRWGLFSTGY